jgi:hypothetical protein
MLRETDVEGTLEECRALINQIVAALSAEEPFVNVSSATELLIYLERVESALKRSVSRSRERGKTKVAALNYRRR